MTIIINMSSMIPIYEQIVDAIKKQIASSELKNGEALPSVRALAKDLKISALTVKKAYDQLESESFISTVHGKGSYVTVEGSELLLEEQKKNIESDLEAVCRKALACGLSADDLKEMLEIITGE